jgi:hypothetical protein
MNLSEFLKLGAVPWCSLLIVACAHDELKVAPGEHAPVSKNVVVSNAPDSPVAAPGLTTTAAPQQAALADTLPTSDRSQWRPKMPIVRAGSCPGEDCEYGYLVTACKDLPLLATDSTGAKQTGIILHKGDTATLVTGNLHLLEPGIVLMKRDYAITDIVDESSDHKAPRPDTLRFFAGDTVYVLDYIELGTWNWWYRGKLGRGDEFWTGVLQRWHGGDDEKKPAVSISRPRGEWWYELQVDSNTEGGWVRAGRGWWVDLSFVEVNSDWKCGGPGGDSDLSGTL